MLARWLAATTVCALPTTALADPALIATDAQARGFAFRSMSEARNAIRAVPQGGHASFWLDFEDWNGHRVPVYRFEMTRTDGSRALAVTGGAVGAETVQEFAADGTTIRRATSHGARHGLRLGAREARLRLDLVWDIETIESALGSPSDDDTVLIRDGALPGGSGTTVAVVSPDGIQQLAVTTFGVAVGGELVRGGFPGSGSNSWSSVHGDVLPLPPDREAELARRAVPGMFWRAPAGPVVARRDTSGSAGTGSVRSSAPVPRATRSGSAGPAAGSGSYPKATAAGSGGAGSTTRRRRSRT